MNLRVRSERMRTRKATRASERKRVRVPARARASRDVSGAEHLVRISRTGIGGFGAVRVMIDHHCDHEAHAEVNMAGAAMQHECTAQGSLTRSSERRRRRRQWDRTVEAVGQAEDRVACPRMADCAKALRPCSAHLM